MCIRDRHNGSSLVKVPEWTQKPRMYGGGAKLCDMLLVDGDHSSSGAFKDLINFRAAAAPTSILVVDDINADPGEALRWAQARSLLRVSEVYGPFDAPSIYNPCMRASRGSSLCLSWGFAVGRYVEAS